MAKFYLWREKKHKIRVTRLGKLGRFCLLSRSKNYLFWWWQVHGYYVVYLVMIVDHLYLNLTCQDVYLMSFLRDREKQEGFLPVYLSHLRRYSRFCDFFTLANDVFPIYGISYTPTFHPYFHVHSVSSRLWVSVFLVGLDGLSIHTSDLIRFFYDRWSGNRPVRCMKYSRFV